PSPLSLSSLLPTLLSPPPVPPSTPRLSACDRLPPLPSIVRWSPPCSTLRSLPSHFLSCSLLSRSPPATGAPSLPPATASTLPPPSSPPFLPAPLSARPTS